MHQCLFFFHVLWNAVLFIAFVLVFLLLSLTSRALPAAVHWRGSICSVCFYWFFASLHFLVCYVALLYYGVYFYIRLI